MGAFSFIFVWEQRELNECVLVNSGKDYKKLKQGNIPVYGTGGYMLSVNKALSYTDAIGIGRKGTIDKPQLLKAPFWTVDTLFYITLKPNNNLYFFFTLFQNINWKKYDESTGLPSLSKATIDKINVNIPSNKEQLKIGKAISQIDFQLHLQQRKLEQLKLIKTALYKDLFDINDGIPLVRFNQFRGNWKFSPFLNKIDEIIDYRGKTPKKLNLNWSRKGILALSALNIKNNFIDKNNPQSHYGSLKLYKKWMGEKELYKGQVIFTTEAPMGKVAQIPDNDKYILSQRTIAFIPKKDLSDDFLANLLLTNKIQLRLKSLSSGGTAQGISQKSLTFLSIYYPSIQEQYRISKVITNINIVISNLNMYLNNLKKAKKFLLQNMFI